jgi:hypothetical protein
MKATYPSSSTHWLRTDHPVSSMSASMWRYLPAVEDALHHGIAAVPDKNRPEFYEIEVGGHWYYIHIPTRIAGVYLIAAGKTEETKAFDGRQRMLKSAFGWR